MINIEVRQLTATDAEDFPALRTPVTAENPMAMGLTFDEKLTRPMQGLRDQLSAPTPNAALGVFVDGNLRGCAAVA